MSDREARQLIWVNREGLTEEGNLKEEAAGGRWGDLGESSPSRGHSMCKGSEVGTSMACLKTRKGAPCWSICQGQEQ